MSRPLLLDLFAGAGGSACGYHRAGFDVVGCDHRPSPRYPYSCWDDDAMEVLDALAQGKRWRGFRAGDFAAIHASPPCQRYSEATRTSGMQDKHPDLVAPARLALERIGRPWVIENVPGAPLVPGQCVMLCGTLFGLKVIRHRIFESSYPLFSPGQLCRHPPRGTVGRAGVRGKKPGDWISVAGSTDLKVASVAMGIDWMRNRYEIAQAIPPAYCEFIGAQLRRALS